MAYNLRGKFAVVTGGGSGICHALTKMLLEPSCSVLVVDLRLRPEAQETLNNRTDMTNWAQTNTMWNKALATFSRIDIVVNGAGVFEPPSSSFWTPLGTSAEAEDDPNAEVGQYKLFALNLVGPIRLSQIAVEYRLKPEKKGKVQENLRWLASMGGHGHQMQTPLYYNSKAGVVSMVKSLAKLKASFGIRNSATPIFEPAYCRGPLREEDVSLSADDCAGTIMKVLRGPQYGDESIVEFQMVGTMDHSSVYTRDVALEALYPTVGVFDQVKAAMAEEEEVMIKKLQEHGM